MNIIHSSLFMLSVLCTSLFIPSVAAQSYPARPIRIVAMFAASSANDLNARYAGARMSEHLGVPIVVENKAGGGGVIAVRDVYRARPLGYSLLVANTSFVGITVALKDPQYKIDDYTPVGVLGQSYFALIMHNSIPANSVAEFVNWTKANPGKVNYGTTGPAAGATLSAERFKQLAGIEMTGIPFKGGDLIAASLLSGEVHVYWASLNTARNRMQNKQIVGLAVTADERSTILPQLPTFREAGYPDMVIASWSAVFAPSAIPAPMLLKLREAFTKAAASQEWRSTMEKAELEPFKGTPDQFMVQVRKEAAQLADDYKRLNLPQE